MIEKSFEIKSEKDSNIKLCNIKIQVNNEDYDRILSAVGRSDCNQITKIEAKIGKIAIKFQKVKDFLPELVVDYKLTKILQKVNKDLEELSIEYGVEQITIGEINKGD